MNDLLLGPGVIVDETAVAAGATVTKEAAVVVAATLKDVPNAAAVAAVVAAGATVTEEAVDVVVAAGMRLSTKRHM
jgi:hypothetical protein